MEIKEYLRQHDPVHFDFTNDCTKNDNYRNKEGFEKYFIYSCPKPENINYPAAAKAINENLESCGTIGDPDSSSKLLQNIYSLLWPNIQEDKSEYMMRNGWIYSDTMTSCRTVLNSFVKKELKEKLPAVLKKYKAKYVSNLMCIELYETKDVEFMELLKNEKLEHFIKVYHTLGNYIPVPYGFNSARSGGFCSHDSWDLTLMKIKEYYDAKEKALQSPCLSEIKIITELLHCNSEIISCLKWLNSFKNWDEFVEQNFLQDFVDKDKNNQPIPFCEGHSWECTDIQNFDEFFEKAGQMIEKRSKRMIEEIEKRKHQISYEEERTDIMKKNVNIILDSADMFLFVKQFIKRCQDGSYFCDGEPARRSLDESIPVQFYVKHTYEIFDMLKQYWGGWNDCPDCQCKSFCYWAFRFFNFNDSGF